MWLYKPFFKNLIFENAMNTAYIATTMQKQP